MRVLLSCSSPLSVWLSFRAGQNTRLQTAVIQLTYTHRGQHHWYRLIDIQHALGQDPAFPQECRYRESHVKHAQRTDWFSSKCRVSWQCHFYKFMRRPLRVNALTSGLANNLGEDILYMSHRPRRTPLSDRSDTRVLRRGPASYCPSTFAIPHAWRPRLRQPSTGDASYGYSGKLDTTTLEAPPGIKSVDCHHLT